MTEETIDKMCQIVASMYSYCFYPEDEHFMWKHYGEVAMSPDFREILERARNHSGIV